MNETKSYWAPGKLLLTAEYTVLDGALALAVPTKMGQSFFWKEPKPAQPEKSLYWTARRADGSVMMEACWSWESQTLDSITNREMAESWSKVMREVQKLNPEFFSNRKKYCAETLLDFPEDFGLGSSSTLTALLARAFSVDAYALNEATFRSSGYDVAVGLLGKTLHYRKKPFLAKPVNFKPSYREDLLFGYQNCKRNSRDAINAYREHPPKPEIIEKISAITQEVTQCDSAEKLDSLLQRHETLTAAILRCQTLKESRFADCPVFIKSLGAWGGDFFMTRKFDGWEKYFSGKNIHYIKNWEEMIYD